MHRFNWLVALVLTTFAMLSMGCEANSSESSEETVVAAAEEGEAAAEEGEAAAPTSQPSGE